MTSEQPLRGLLVDLDGVVYRGHEPCPGAVEGLERARRHGIQVLFITNNASRTARDTAAFLQDLGVAADEDDVLTSSRVAGEVLRDLDLPGEGARALAVGGPGLAETLADLGLSVVRPEQLRRARDEGSAVPAVSVVVQGFGPDLGVSDLTEAAYAVAAGARWVATNDDATIPTPHGLAPGNGSLLAAVAHALGRGPDLVTGKPHPPAYEIAARVLGVDAGDLLAIGDRLDTDIAGANAAGLRTALVLTGVHGRDDVEAAEPQDRPGHVADTIPDLLDELGVAS